MNISLPGTKIHYPLDNAINKYSFNRFFLLTTQKHLENFYYENQRILKMRLKDVSGANEILVKYEF